MDILCEGGSVLPARITLSKAYMSTDGALPLSLLNAYTWMNSRRRATSACFVQLDAMGQERMAQLRSCWTLIRIRSISSDIYVADLVGCRVLAVFSSVQEVVTHTKCHDSADNNRSIVDVCRIRDWCHIGKPAVVQVNYNQTAPHGEGHSPAENPDHGKEEDSNSVIDDAPKLSQLEDAIPFPTKDIWLIDARVERTADGHDIRTCQSHCVLRDDRGEADVGEEVDPEKQRRACRTDGDRLAWYLMSFKILRPVSTCG